MSRKHVDDGEKKQEWMQFLGGVTKADGVQPLLLRTQADELPRIAIAGRSNVGKSSLLNALTGYKMARVSGEPGKTREMNFFNWKPSKGIDPMLLVDLPGYGYAKVARELKKQWGLEITRWLKEDKFLNLVLSLVDGRHGFLENDVELLRFLQDSRLPHLICFTKMDKWKSNNQRKTAERELAAVAARLGVSEFLFLSAHASGGTHSLQKVLKSLAIIKDAP